MNILSIIDFAKKGQSTIGLAYTGIMSKRFRTFMTSCRKELEVSGALSSMNEVELLKWFETDFAKARLYDYSKKPLIIVLK
jgi:hypothetical protein